MRRQPLTRGEWWQVASAADSGSRDDFSDALFSSSAEIVNVKGFGATGKKDDYAAIQDAIDRAEKNGGGDVILPPVDDAYTINRGIVVPGGVRLRGFAWPEKANPNQRQGGSVLRAGATMDALVTLQNESTNSFGRAVLQDLWVDGSTFATDTVLVTGVQHKIYDSRITNGTSTALTIQGTSAADIRVSRCRIQMNDVAGTTVSIETGSDCRLINCKIGGARTRNLYVNTGGNVFENCHIFAAPANASDVNSHIVVEGADKNLFLGCFIDKCEIGPVVIVKTGASASSSGNRFLGCVWSNEDIPDNTVSAIELDASDSGQYVLRTSIDGCDFRGSPAHRWANIIKNDQGTSRVLTFELVGTVRETANLYSNKQPDYMRVQEVSGANDSTIVQHECHKFQPTSTISSGAVAFTGPMMKVDTESAASTDDLDTISGGHDGQYLMIRAANNARTVVLKDNVDNIVLDSGTDVSLTHSEDSILLRKDGSNWVQVAPFSNNSA